MGMLITSLHAGMVKVPFGSRDLNSSKSRLDDILVPHSLDLADIDNDGDLDAVTCSKDPVDVAAWYENHGDGRFTKNIGWSSAGFYDTRGIDMDGDGDQDVLIAGHTSNNVVWYENSLITHKSSSVPNSFFGNWALKQPDGSAAWLRLFDSEGKLKGEYWAVGGGRQLGYFNRRKHPKFLSKNSYW